ncbi:carboxypeptidase-like regulatory domain-containing protein [Proteiniphilum sp.]|uniref:carboxypeptidase-like regulatory domain-containing protein n=1 Tax=Proteiniphilum sp. TaxID=1926877 RepID=UPI002B2097AA|nr:carboxypeptidase-like regulatory domain-containing protein [Proteiniphilum sp.]MEA4916323.1 carboxypeptidase-like regulatory domain-containing protein [Proteiniphilum sp.]
MKRTLLTLVILFISISTLTFGQGTPWQKSLPESRRSSGELFVYQLNEKDVRNLYLKGKRLDESMLHTFVMRCAESKDIPALPRGNYIEVRTVDNKLEYSDHTVDNFYYNIVKDEKVMLFISDTLGNVITDAVVKRGLKRLKFDESTRTYNTRRIADEKIVEVNNNGVLHYIEFEEGYRYHYRPHFFRSSWYRIRNGFYRIFDPDMANIPDKYDGFVVCSKPKYKPGETVRFKGYIHHNGKPYNKEVEVSLVSRYPAKIDTTLVSLQPYRPGMYEWEFVLTDSLKLLLDNRYNIELKTRGRNGNHISGEFRYEEYELGRVSFEAKADKERYVKGDTVKLQFSAKDENDMPVYDGRIDITVRPSRRSEWKYYADNSFIPDELWKHSLDMDTKASSEFVLPDSLFVPGMGIHYEVECGFLDSGNEKQVSKMTLYMDTRDRQIDFSVKKGFLTIREMVEGTSRPVQASLIAYNSEGEISFSDSVQLPYSLPLQWIADHYEVTTATSSGIFFVKDIKENILEYRFFREAGNIRLVADNPAGYPFWYTIRKGKEIIKKGYTSNLDYSYKDKGKQGYTMQLAYLLGEEAKTVTGSLPYEEKNISMEVNTPTMVYPGQTAKVELLVRDKKGRPVKNADITAYAYTSKFNMHSPNVAIFGKSVSGKRFDNRHYDLSEAGPYNAKSPMDWSIWKERMGLDSIEYYKFLYPSICYEYSEEVPDRVTQIAPYVVIDGNPQGVHILWIDDQPHYFYRAQQLDVYSFPVAPGYHTLKFRTYGRNITVENVYVREGMKTILSVNAEKSAVLLNSGDKVGDHPLQITVKNLNRKNRGRLSEWEMAQLEEHMITVDNNVGTVSLPNDNPIYIPAVFHAGRVYYLLNSAVDRRYEYRTGSYLSESTLVGPFPHVRTSSGDANVGGVYADTMFINSFPIEGGHRYEVRKDSVARTKWGKVPFSASISPFSSPLAFSQNALTPESVTGMFREGLLDRIERKAGLMMSTGVNNGKGRRPEKNNPVVNQNERGCQLKLVVGSLADGKMEAKPLMICLSSMDESNEAQYIYYGATRDFNQLPEGNWQLDLIFRDTTRYAIPVTLKPNGLNYLKIDSITPLPVDSIGRTVFARIDSHLYLSQPKNLRNRISVISGHSGGDFRISNYTGKLITGTVRDQYGEPLIGATVKVEGTTKGTMTDLDGKFRLANTDSGNLLVAYIGYQPFTIRITAGYDYQIILEEDYQALEEVVVTAFGVQKKVSVVGSVTTVNPSDLHVPSGDLATALAGRMAGVVALQRSGEPDVSNDKILIRGASSSEADYGAPLIIINGIPYEGALSDFDAANIVSMNVVKDADTAIYGSRAANGIIFIETKDGGTPIPLSADSAFPEGWSSANSLRTNFHDDAFWKPRLSTGSDGTLSFEVTYPDDITSWNANFIAVGGRKQTDKAQLKVKSFKPINAQLSLPQFAILNDSLNVIGRLTNHLGDTVTIQRTIEWEEDRSEEPVSLQNSYIDTIPLLANKPDSITITYALKMESGYFDGERRTIPVYQPGILESYGEFAVLGDTLSHRFQTNPALGKVTVHAQTTAMQSFLDEIEKIDRYPYFCNEQVASKIKALLLKKQILPMVGKEFKEDNKIRSLIRRLERNKNSENLWGWWNQDKTELWISKQIVEALINAEADGYKVDFNKQGAANALIRELNRRLLVTDDASDDSLVKQELLNLLELLLKLNAQIDYTQYLREISLLPDITVNNKLRSVQMALLLDSTEVSNNLPIDALLNLSSETMLGSIYWGEKEDDIYPRYFMLPNVNNTNNTLVAYRILREVGGHDDKLEKIRNYFFEIRKNGSWQNTYESARIMETIMPDMIAVNSTFSNTKLTVNGKEYKEFPLTVEFEAGETVDVRKTGTLPIFFTAYQQGWNSDPEKVSEGFSVETAFYDKDDIITRLEAGKSVDLKVNVTVDADADYVMIEVPIPAGCSYESKGRGDFRKETHREYHKEKVAIFCHKLSKGSHDFIIKLIPRYTGQYHLNPAKAELMYFPTFFGRGDVGRCAIE